MVFELFSNCFRSVFAVCSDSVLQVPWAVRSNGVFELWVRTVCSDSVLGLCARVVSADCRVSVSMSRVCMAPNACVWLPLPMFGSHVWLEPINLLNEKNSLFLAQLGK